MPPALTLEFPSSSTRPECRSRRSDACARPWSSREGAVAWRLVASMMVLLAPARAAKMSLVEYAEAIRALDDGAERVGGAEGKYFWRANAAMAATPPDRESWYLHSGSAHLPIGLQALIKKPDGAPATRSPDSAAMLGYTGSGGVAWPNHAHNHLVFPRLWALLPPSCKRAVLWNPETAKLDGVSAPPRCSAAAPGYGYMDVPAGTSPEALQRRPGNPLLILLEAKCVAGVLPHPKGTGPREALQPAIAGMVRWRADDNASPALTPGVLPLSCCPLATAP